MLQLLSCRLPTLYLFPFFVPKEPHKPIPDPLFLSILVFVTSPSSSRRVATEVRRREVQLHLRNRNTTGGFACLNIFERAYLALCLQPPGESLCFSFLLTITCTKTLLLTTCFEGDLNKVGSVNTRLLGTLLQLQVLSDAEEAED